MIRFLTGLSTWLWLSSANAAATLQMVGDNWCPYNCMPEAKQRGYMVELLEHAFGADHNLIYTVEPWSRAVQMVEAGQQDILIATPISSTPTLRHSVPLGVDRTCFFVRQENPWRYRQLADLKSMSLGVIQDYNYDDDGPLDALIAGYRKRKDARLEVAYGKDALSANFRKLQAGRMDVVIENENVGQYTIKQLGLSDSVRNAGCANHHISETRIAISPTLSDGKALLERLKVTIETMRRSGELAELLGQYGMQDWQPLLKKPAGGAR